jgi:hypothetical protein
MLGIPVLGTRGASIDELVEENECSGQTLPYRPARPSAPGDHSPDNDRGDHASQVDNLPNTVRVCDGVASCEKRRRYGVISASEKNVVTAAARASRSCRSFGSR